MVNSCIVWGCTNRDRASGIKRSFYDIPKFITSQGSQTEKLSTERRALWLSRITRKNYNPDPSKRHYNFCSDHFVPGKKVALYDRNNPDWAPSLKMTDENDLQTAEKQASSLSRYSRVKNREGKKVKLGAAETLLSLLSVCTNDDYVSVPTTSTDRKPCSFFVRGRLETPRPIVREEEPQILRNMRAEFQRLSEENRELKNKIVQMELNEESLRDNDMVKHMSGLNFVTFMALLNFISPRLQASARHFQKLLLVMMKLTQFKCKGLGISISSGTFIQTIHVMYVMMKRLIYWPEREDLRMSMPMDFRKNFGVKVAIIIDCFEIFIERPSSLLARSETWSNYTHHNTIKYLV